ncbi:MAG: alpha-mannosidase [Pirellulaceae bacterium]
MKTIATGGAAHHVLCVLTLLAAGSCRGAVAAEPDTAAPAPDKDIFLFIPHTHWEGAVFKTREEYLDMGLSNILRALALLKAYPDYRFVLDQACYVKPFLERYPEEGAAFRQFVQEGRLAIVGGTDVMADVNMPGGESFVRQMLYGKGYFRQKLGVDVTVGWQLDTFGHHPQMPQLLKLGGYKSFWTQRGMVDPNTPSEFLWEGIDGSQIPTFWLPQSYALTSNSPTELPAFSEFIQQRFAAIAPYSRGRGRVGLAGTDVCEPEVHVPALVEPFNRLAVAPFELRFAVPTDFEALVAERPDRPVVRGDFNPIFQGTYSSRIELKQRTRELERLLTTAEKLGVMLHGLSVPIDDEVIWRAWEPMLFNQAHDLMSGVMTDHVYEDTIRGYDFSRRIATDEVQSRLRATSAAIDTQGAGIPVVVWNMLGWPRTDIVVAQVGMSDSGVTDVSMVGPDGQAVPVQLLHDVRSRDGALLEAQVAFVARDVPALGYSLYRVLPLRTPTATTAAAQDEPVLENEFYRLEFDPASGAMTSLVEKSSQWNVLGGLGNVVAREEDRGDLWELYHNLESGFVTNKTPHGPPEPGKAIFSSEQSGTPGTVSRGAVFSEFKVAHPFGGENSFATTVRLYAGLRRIDIRTQVLNNEKSVRYRVLFPTSIRGGQAYHEIPFGAIERPVGIELPAQNWVDYGNSQQGLAVLNRGLPGNNVADGTMLLSLARSTRIQAYGYGGGYEPGMSSDSGFELGQEFTFNYALVPHTGDWRAAGVYRDGLEFNQPLLAHTAALHDGSGPSRWGLMQITPQNVVLSALKPGRDGTAVLRVYEATGTPTRASIRLSTQIAAAEEVNLMEDSGPKLAVTDADNTLQFDLRAFEIKTIKLWLKPEENANR